MAPSCRYTCRQLTAADVDVAQLGGVADDVGAQPADVGAEVEGSAGGAGGVSFEPSPEMLARYGPGLEGLFDRHLADPEGAPQGIGEPEAARRKSRRLA